MTNLQAEAGRLLEKLLPILQEYGEPHIIGSASMDLMAWPDVDVDVVNTGMTLEKLHRLTRTLLDEFAPVWYEAKEEVNDEGKTVWFHGMETMIGGTRWNFDIWFFDRETIDKAEAYCHTVQKAAEKDPAVRSAILTLKKDLLERGLYSFEKYTSMDVYKAVMECGIRDTETFLKEYKK